MSDIVAAARAMLGTRYAHQGRGPAGVDCAGLVILAARARGCTLDFNGYPRHARDESMLDICEQHLQRVPVAEAAPGDVMVFAVDHQRHMGILGDYVHGGLSLIHAYLPARRVVEVRLDEGWLRRAVAAFRFPETF